MLFAPTLLSIVLLSVLIGAAAGSALLGHPRAALQVSASAAAITFAVIGVHVAVPIIHQAPGTTYPWLSIATDYFMAMGHRMSGTPYPFMWTPEWVYEVSVLTPLIAPGAMITVVAGFIARHENRAAASVLMAAGGLWVTALAVFGSYEAFTIQVVPG